MLHDESMYPEPDVFKPDRFLNADGTLNSNVRRPEEIAFGVSSLARELQLD